MQTKTMTGRRTFINQMAMVAGAILIRPMDILAGTNADLPPIATKKTLTILHAAGLNGQWSPLKEPSSLHGLGGLVNVQKEIETIKNQFSSPLLVQSGNIISHQCNQENCLRFYRALSVLDFDVVIPGAYDLAHGKDVFCSLAHDSGLPVSLFQQAAASGGSLLPSAVVVKNAMRIGVIHADGASVHEAEALTKTARMLKAKKCLLVVCVVEGNAKACAALAALSESVDVMLAAEEILSLNTTRILQNKMGQEVLLSFAGSQGTLLNRIDFTFNEKGEKINIASKAIFVGVETPSYAAISKRCTLSTPHNGISS